MNPSRLLVLFGNQLFANRVAAEVGADTVFMVESEGMCRQYAAHRHKLVLVLSAMRSKADALRSAGYEVAYTKLESGDGRTYWEILAAYLDAHPHDEVAHFETASPLADARLRRVCEERGVFRRTFPSPMFLTSREAFDEYRAGHKRLFMADFYRWQRKRLAVLLDEQGDPLGGKWSFDEENRKKLPKGLVPPNVPSPAWTSHTRELVRLVDERFREHPGKASDFWLPTTEPQAEEWLHAFVDERFALFGDYEDALSSKHGFIFHSVLSPMMNIGLLTPQHVLDVVLRRAGEARAPLNSLEGFVRQVIGWREFVHGVWNTLPKEHWAQNFWGHERRLTKHWYDGTTGIPPLDDAICRARATGYGHHIERLMVLGNLMLLCRIEPKEAYGWFMEMFVDSADWVMAPNLYGMALFSEGGAFTTKPYVCGSSYLRRMSDYSKGPWCDVVDGLYWSFIDDHRDFFEQNARSKVMLRALERIDHARRDRIFRLAREFIERVTD